MAQCGIDTIAVLTTLVAFAAARDLLSLSVPVSLSVQELALAVPMDRREPTGSCHCSVLCPSVRSKGKPAMLALVRASPPWHQWKLQYRGHQTDLLSSESEIGSYSSHLRSCSHYSLRHFHPSLEQVKGVPSSAWSGGHWGLCQSSGPFETCEGSSQFPGVILGVPIRWPWKEGWHHLTKQHPVWTPVPNPVPNCKSQLNRILLRWKGKKSIHSWCWPPPSSRVRQSQQWVCRMSPPLGDYKTHEKLLKKGGVKSGHTGGGSES